MRAILRMPAGSMSATFDYYISTTGSDSNAGTMGSPWAITAINTKRATYAGKRVGLMDGTYDVSGMTAPTGGFDAVLAVRGGSAGAPTVIQAVNARQAIIKGNNGATYPFNDCSLMGEDVSAGGHGYITIDGIKFTGSACKTIVLAVSTSDTGTRWSGYIVQNCEITGMDCRTAIPGGNNACIQIYISDGAQVINNYMHDNIAFGGALDIDHWSSVQFFFGDNALMEYNTSIGGAFYGKASSCKNPQIRFNYIDLTGYTGVTYVLEDFATDSATSGTTRVHHNVLIGAENDMRPFPYGAGQGFSSNFEFYNNTVIIRDSGASQGLLARVSAGLGSLYNNIFYSEANGDQAFLTINQDWGLVDYDLYYSSVGSPQWGYYINSSDGTRNTLSNFATWKSQLGGAEAHAVNGSDPLFVASGARADYYKLQAGSPAKNAGRSNGTTAGSVCDMGAWGNGATRVGCNF